MKKNSPKKEIGFLNFQNALKQLEEFLNIPVKDKRDRAGVIQAFEFTFEQFWKAVQKSAELEGLTVQSPKQALKAALKLGWLNLDDEKLWLQMLDDRNLTSHTYREEIASDVFSHIKKSYLNLFQSAAVKMKK